MYVTTGNVAYVGGGGMYGGAGMYIRCIIMQITVIVLTVVMGVCQVLNLFIGIIPWAFYIVEITNFFLLIAVLIESLITLVYSIVPHERNKMIIGINIGQSVLSGIILVLIVINMVVGIIPWAFYLIELVNLLLIVVLFFLTVVLIISYFPAIGKASGDQNVTQGTSQYQNFDNAPQQQYRAPQQQLQTGLMAPAQVQQQFSPQVSQNYAPQPIYNPAQQQIGKPQYAPPQPPMNQPPQPVQILQPVTIPPVVQSEMPPSEYKGD